MPHVANNHLRAISDQAGPNPDITLLENKTSFLFFSYCHSPYALVNRDYLQRQLQLWRLGVWVGTSYASMMRNRALRLSDGHIDPLTVYYYVTAQAVT